MRSGRQSPSLPTSKFEKPFIFAAYDSEGRGLRHHLTLPRFPTRRFGGTSHQFRQFRHC